MQLCGTIYCPLIALHVSSDIIAYHQELLNCIFTPSVDTYIRTSLPAGVVRHQQAVTYVCMYHQKLQKYSLEAPDDDR